MTVRLRFTKHAQKQMQQRGISEELTALIVDRGKRTHSGGGTVRYDSAGIDEKSAPKHLAEKLRKHPYVIADEDEIITVAWGYERLKRDMRPRKKRRHYGVKSARR